MNKIIRNILTLALILTIISCKIQSDKIDLTLNSIRHLKVLKSEIDSLKSHDLLKLEILAKEPNKEKLTVVINEIWPEDVETSFNIWRNSENQIILIGEFPFSESGDWDIGYEYYFDDNEKTFSFQRSSSFFNSICANGIAYEKVVRFYDSKFNVIELTYSLIDKDKQSLDKKDCEFNYDFPYKISESLKKYKERIKYGSK